MAIDPTCDHDGCDCGSGPELPATAPGITDLVRIARVQPILDSWMLALALANNWEVRYHFVDDIDERKTAADITRFPPYQTAVLRISRWRMDRYTDGELESLLVHELLHLHLEPIQAVLRGYFNSDKEGAFCADHSDAIEAVCDRLAYVLQGLASREYTSATYSPFDESDD